MALVTLFCLAFVVMQIRNRLGTSPMYDMRLVDEKTARPAYRVRLRLFVFSSEAEHCASTLYSSRRSCCNTSPGNTFTWSSLQDTYQARRETARHNKQLRQEQRDVLDHLVAAYRQYPYRLWWLLHTTTPLAGEATALARAAPRVAAYTSHRLGI